MDLNKSKWNRKNNLLYLQVNFEHSSGNKKIKQNDIIFVYNISLTSYIKIYTRAPLGMGSGEKNRSMGWYYPQNFFSTYPAAYKKNIRQKYDCIRSQILNLGNYEHPSITGRRDIINSCRVCFVAYSCSLQRGFYYNRSLGL